VSEEYITSISSAYKSAMAMEAVFCSEIITFTYHVTTRCNNPETLYDYRQFIGVDLAFFLPLEMRVLLKRIGSLETPAIKELHNTNGWYILGNCLFLITAIAHRLSRQRHKYDTSTLCIPVDGNLSGHGCDVVSQTNRVQHDRTVRVVDASCQCQYTCRKLVPAERIQGNLNVQSRRVATFTNQN
jgi:hypothetical protein